MWGSADGIDDFRLAPLFMRRKQASTKSAKHGGGGSASTGPAVG